MTLCLSFKTHYIIQYVYTVDIIVCCFVFRSKWIIASTLPLTFKDNWVKLITASRELELFNSFITETQCHSSWGGGCILMFSEQINYPFPSLILCFSPMILITQFPPTNAHFHLYFIVPYTHQMFMNINVLSRDFDVFSSHWAFWGMCTLPYASNRFFF